nr:hypothetical protein BaRGS_025277 [Batillaria attramentaria]
MDQVIHHDRSISSLINICSFSQTGVSKQPKELAVNVSSLSSTRRQKESAPDSRASSTSMGVAGMVVVALLLGGIVFWDVWVMIAHFRFGVRYNLQPIYPRA